MQIYYSSLQAYIFYIAFGDRPNKLWLHSSGDVIILHDSYAQTSR
jgi:hypothetical protein